MFRPSYLKLSSDEIKKKIESAYNILENCSLCPRNCDVNRIKDKTGYCNSGKNVKLNSYFSHKGEEPPISGIHGSGTVFLCGCTMSCLFCQNYQISHLGRGKKISNDELADIFIELQDEGCHNINIVTPTQWVPQILSAVEIARPKGFKLPIVYNTNGYETVETLKILDGIVDIYLPDIKYSDNEKAKMLSQTSNYVEKNRKALKEMYSQVGNLKLDDRNIAQRGMIVRHLILPENMAGTREALTFLKNTFGKEINISLMAQYTPMFKAEEIPDINRRLTVKEYQEAIALLEELDLENGWYQHIEDLDEEFVFDFR